MAALTFEWHKKRFNFTFYTDVDHVSRIMATTTTFYEIGLLDYLRTIGIHGAIAIDVGANIGNHSVYFGNFITGHVICVEANNKLIPILKKNCHDNLESYEIVSKALGERNGAASLTFPLKDNVGAAKLIKGHGAITITTLDEVAPISGVVLVKIDVEGMELEVLSGATRLLSTQRPHLIIEAATEDLFFSIKQFLTQYEYKYITKWNATPTYHFAYKPSQTFIVLSRFVKFKSKLHGAITKYL